MMETSSPKPMNSSRSSFSAELVEYSNSTSKSSFQPFTLGTAHQVNLFENPTIVASQTNNNNTSTSIVHHGDDHHHNDHHHVDETRPLTKTHQMTKEQQTETSLLFYFFGFCMPLLWIVNFGFCMRFRWKNDKAREYVQLGLILLAIYILIAVVLVTITVILVVILVPLKVYNRI